MAYSLDTSTIVFCLRGKSAKLANRLRTTPVSDLRVPMQVFAELLVGAAKSAKPAANEAVARAFVSPYFLLWPNEQVINHTSPFDALWS